MSENFLNLVKDINSWIQETERMSNKINSKKSTLRHIMMKFLKLKTKKKLERSQKEKRE